MKNIFAPEKTGTLTTWFLHMLSSIWPCLDVYKRQVSGIFAKHGVSIESCVQKGQGESAVPLIFVTHKSREADIVRAVAEIDQLDYISIGSVIRVEI